MGTHSVADIDVDAMRCGACTIASVGCGTIDDCGYNDVGADYGDGADGYVADAAGD